MAALVAAAGVRTAAPSDASSAHSSPAVASAAPSTTVVASAAPSATDVASAAPSATDVASAAPCAGAVAEHDRLDLLDPAHRGAPFRARSRYAELPLEQRLAKLRAIWERRADRAARVGSIHKEARTSSRTSRTSSWFSLCAA